MAGDLPEFYFRVRDGGATVFRVDTTNRHRRIEMDQIASVSMRSGDIRPAGDRTLSTEEEDAIKTWIADRQETLDWRRIDDILRTVDHLNATAHWAQSQASDEELNTVTDSLLMAMHDLRTVLARKQAERLTKS